jgi:hypothetical protein
VAYSARAEIRIRPWEIAEKAYLAAGERRWTPISDGKRFVFNLRSSAFISGQPRDSSFSITVSGFHFGGLNRELPLTFMSNPLKPKR